jgi:homoserine dehydrogenase
VAERVGVGLLGFGTVGSAVARRLVDEWQLLRERCGGVTPVLRAVAMRDLSRRRELALPDTVRRTDDALSVVDDPSVDLVIEVMGGVDVAAACIERALSAGKRVVTANKAVIATRGPQLAELGAAHGASLWFEATVCAGLPICALLRDSLRGDRILSLDGIVNGTTNVVLTRMQREQESLETALRDAQQRGFAESDPSSDIDGWDATYKLVILTWLAFAAQVPPDLVDRRGIRAVREVDLAYATRLGYTVKLLAHAAAQQSGVEMHVRPALIPAGHPLYGVDDSENAVLLRSDCASTVILRGLGAGGESTASAVVSDLVQAIRTHPAPAPPAFRVIEPVGDEDVDVCGYIRVALTPAQDAPHLVVQALEDRGVPVRDAIDAAQSARSQPELLLLTGSAPRAVHERALETLETLPAVREVAAALDRVER